MLVGRAALADDVVPPDPSPADAPAPVDAPAPASLPIVLPVSPLRIGGYLESSYSWNFSRPRDGVTAQRGFDSQHNSLTIENVALDAQWTSGRVTGQLTLQAGSTPTSYYGSDAAIERGIKIFNKRGRPIVLVLASRSPSAQGCFCRRLVLSRWPSKTTGIGRVRIYFGRFLFIMLGRGQRGRSRRVGLSPVQFIMAGIKRPTAIKENRLPSTRRTPPISCLRWCNILVELNGRLMRPKVSHGATWLICMARGPQIRA